MYRTIASASTMVVMNGSRRATIVSSGDLTSLASSMIKQNFEQMEQLLISRNKKTHSSVSSAAGRACPR